ncbi:MAG: GH36-type glycosyl hydrolase domain-containing protein, partial [Aureliella sp.]
RSFGVPGLGLKRGLAKDLVISPYSTMLALPLEPLWAVENLRTLSAEGAFGDWGFYEALDYTPSRLRRGKRVVQVECYMAHHQGMSLTALANASLDNVMQRRFHAHPWARANELLLQERVPQVPVPSRPHAGQLEQAPVHRDDSGLISRRITGVQTATPRTHILSNGQTSVMVSHVGGGYLQWQDQLVTRWRRDTTRDNWGTFIYLRDVQTDELWSATYQPTLTQPDAYEVIFAMDKAEFHRRQGDIESVLEVAVSPENNAEVRQLRLVNRGAKVRYIDVTSYAEVALNTPAADLAHPAFQKLFVETEYIAEETSLIARRRLRSAGQSPLYAVHTIVAPGNNDSAVQYETSRRAFLGRNRSTEAPAGATAQRLAGHVGAVLDPIFALRCRVTLAPDEAVTISFTTAVAQSRQQALALADQYHDQRGTHRAFELAWAFAQSESRYRNVDGAKMHVFQRLGSALLYPDPNLRGDPSVLRRNRMSQPGLWRYGISGDLPIILCRVTDTEHVGLVSELVMAHRFLLEHGLHCDLVIVNDYPGSYFDALQDQLQQILNDAHLGDRRHGANHLLRGAQMPVEDHVLLETVASCVFAGEAGDLTQQLDIAASRRPSTRHALPVQPLRIDAPSRRYPAPPKTARALNAPSAKPSGETGTATETSSDSQLPVDGELEFDNGLGGFAADGQVYQISLSTGLRPPAPWSNVIANPRFGTLVTEAGGGFTWFRNSRENKLTAWCNDPVTDRPSEILYIHDAQARELWSPLPSLTAAHGSYVCRHGHGSSQFEHASHGLEHETLIAVAADDPVKFIRLRIHNPGEQARVLDVTYYVDWVLGVAREQTDMVIATDRDADSGALLATNSYSMEFGDQVAFLQVLSYSSSVTGDRRAFLGRNGSPLSPISLAMGELDGRTGAGLDPCGAIQCKVTVAPATTEEIVFLLGAGETRDEAMAVLHKFSDPEAVAAELKHVQRSWQDMLSVLQVKTPNRGMDIMLNGWLQYQTLSCRVWGRSAFYQSGGAFGFRDQLQDVMAVVHSRPDVTREQILRAAARQFKEGDVQHWWHPPGGKGTRTRFSDDFLFLPFVTDFYIRATGDTAILDVEIPFLVSPPLHEHEQERYEQPQVASEKASLYQHCCLALEHGRRYGRHGLPLMGCGDWNDGMNKVGEGGEGESVWVAFFQIVVFERFAEWMRARGDEHNATKFSAEAARLRSAVESQAWDGRWYRRAYFDDGTPLGSHENSECRIDSLAQSWSVIAGADPERARQAMDSAVEQLVRDDDGLILLFTPAFDQSDLDPGYIKGYLPGIRENGAQYTHAATWMVDAAARLGDGALAVRLFDIINPIHHARTPAEVARYQVEPYVVAADVYSAAAHVGTGGWTWYTGSASWTYRVAVESILGIVIEKDRLTVRPCVPDEWTEFEFTFRRGTTSWTVHMQRTESLSEPFSIDLVEDGQAHRIEGQFYCGLTKMAR